MIVCEGFFLNNKLPNHIKIFKTYGFQTKTTQKKYIYVFDCR